MKTIYIDVYFLINFSVDFLALNLTSRFTKTAVKPWRILLGSALGALCAVFSILFINIKYIYLIVSPFILLLMILICTFGISFFRKMKFLGAFLITEILIGGFVYYGFSFLEEIFSEYEPSGGENRNLLIVSLIILLSFGVLKLFMAIFCRNSSISTAQLSLYYNGQKHEFEGLVDSGNLAIDPMDGRCVVLINCTLAKSIFKEDIKYMDSPELAPFSIKKRIRIIPIKRGGVSEMLYAFTMDEVFLISGKRKEKIPACFAIDKKGEKYGGYDALIPAALISDVY